MKIKFLFLLFLIIINNIYITFGFNNNYDQLNSFDQSSSESSSGTNSEGCYGVPNPHTVYTQKERLVASVSNGVLYQTGPNTNQLYILHLYGTPFEMGEAHGQLLKAQIQDLLPSFMEFAQVAVKQFIKSKFAERLPAFLIYIIETFGVNAALDYVSSATKPYTPQSFFDELKGISYGAEVDYTTLLRIHSFAELLKATCSIVGAWGDATLDGRLLQVRALDWGIENPLVNHPVLIVYHPETGNGGPFSILTWVSYVGALTGYSQRTGVCEKVWLTYNGTYTHDGIPFTLMLKEILQYDNNNIEALNRIYNTPKTCAIYVGVGSNESATVDIIEYSSSTVRVFDDETPFPGFDPSPPDHPIIKNIVYVDRHSQPSNDPCLANELISTYGSISAATLIDTVGKEETGDLHAAVYDFSENVIYVSIASTNIPFPFPNKTMPSPAYKNQFMKLDMNTLFNLPNPTNNK
ncbi:hypothetical protein DICPUDRAFT_153322 [Dictyostelium purpureum]|uniref:Acid ceramidase N-terminal domain-containing protein n=1 Tax=Dictyostelium purpureum TaxID=5786 RepID=F0ZNL7_DICPU|nr:uncharacterized protein DICPUDRAFT_153322 [Dictyostelium purpureum]EGC34478.1 hypothetical protein DICPUDRAFT_153322 [Dictyostelium purpureum]|eukprot:XP_003289013.1 hypothetical protein DICPUDRAFT_153322 [Dictyostelium purpureum]